MAARRAIAVDLDGTILRNKKPFKDIIDFGKPEKKVRECLSFLKTHGFDILIHSTRLNYRINTQPPAWLRQNVVNILDVEGIPFDEIFMGPAKPLAEFYVDDRGVFYAGDWEETMKEILARAEKSFKNIY